MRPIRSHWNIKLCRPHFPQVACKQTENGISCEDPSASTVGGLWITHASHPFPLEYQALSPSLSPSRVQTNRKWGFLRGPISLGCRLGSRD